LFLLSLLLTLRLLRLKEGKKRRERESFHTLPRIQILVCAGDVAKDPARLSTQKAASPNHRFQFHKRRQLFIRTHNETLSVAAMRVSIPSILFKQFLQLLYDEAS
jgi:hypothetical protein